MEDEGKTDDAADEVVGCGDEDLDDDGVGFLLTRRYSVIGPSTMEPRPFPMSTMLER